MSDPLKPYTVTEKHEEGGFVTTICRDGKVLVSSDYIDPDSLAAILNDAFLKGVETERARAEAEALAAFDAAMEDVRLGRTVPLDVSLNAPCPDDANIERAFRAVGQAERPMFPPATPERLAQLAALHPKLNDNTKEAFAAIETASQGEPPITLPWSDLTDSAKDSIRASYPWSKWTEAQLAACQWTKMTFDATIFHDTMCLWRPAAPKTVAEVVESAPNPPVYLIAEREPVFPASQVGVWLYHTGFEEWQTIHSPLSVMPQHSHWSPISPNLPSVKPTV